MSLRLQKLLTTGRVHFQGCLPAPRPWTGFPEYSPKMLTVPGWVRKAEGSAEAGEVGLILELLDPIS